MEGVRSYITAAGALQARIERSQISSRWTYRVPRRSNSFVCAVRGVETLIKRAKAAGTVRADCTAEDVLILLQSNAGLIERSKGAAASASQRLVHLLLDGLRVEAATDGPLPPAPRRMRAAMRERSRDFGFDVSA